MVVEQSSLNLKAVLCFQYVGRVDGLIDWCLVSVDRRCRARDGETNGSLVRCPRVLSLFAPSAGVLLREHNTWKEPFSCWSFHHPVMACGGQAPPSSLLPILPALPCLPSYPILSYHRYPSFLPCLPYLPCLAFLPPLPYQPCLTSLALPALPYQPCLAFFLIVLCFVPAPFGSIGKRSVDNCFSTDKLAYLCSYSCPGKQSTYILTKTQRKSRFDAERRSAIK
jgi:hypothetical protein